MPETATKNPRSKAGAKRIGFWKLMRAYHITESTSELKKFGFDVTEDEGIQYLQEFKYYTKVGKREGMQPSAFMVEFGARLSAANEKLKAFLSQSLRNYNP